MKIGNVDVCDDCGAGVTPHTPECAKFAQYARQGFGDRLVDKMVENDRRQGELATALTKHIREAWARIYHEEAPTILVTKKGSNFEFRFEDFTEAEIVRLQACVAEAVEAVRRDGLLDASTAEDRVLGEIAGELTFERSQFKAWIDRLGWKW
jgi:hypothetical protein